MERQPQNPEFKINPENFHPCSDFFYLRILHLLRISFYFIESQRVPRCNSMADWSLKTVFWTHKIAVGTN